MKAELRKKIEEQNSVGIDLINHKWQRRDKWGWKWNGEVAGIIIENAEWKANAIKVKMKDTETNHYSTWEQRASLEYKGKQQRIQRYNLGRMSWKEKMHS